MGIPEGEEKEKGAERFCKEIIAENFPSLGKELNVQVREAKRTQLSQHKKIFCKTHYIKTVKSQ